MRRINFKFLLVLILGVLICGGGFVLLRGYQVSRNAGGKLALARTRLEEGRLAEALNLFGQYIALRPQDHAAFAEYSKLLLGRATAPDATRSDLAKAFNTLETAVRRNPEDDALRQQLAEFQLRVGRATDAREHLAVLEERLAVPAPAATEGDETVAERAQQVRRVQLLKASSYLTTGEFEEAARIVSAMLGYDLTDRRFRREDGAAAAETDAYVMLAAILQERFDAPADAREVLQELVANRGTEPQAWLAMSAWFRERGSLDEAAEAVAKALELAPDDPNCVFAEFELALTGRDFEQAEAVARRAVELFPDDERSYRGLAAMQIQRGDLAGAERLLLEGVERLPGKPSLMLMLTDTLLQEGKFDEAAQAINRIREIYGASSGPVGLLEARLLIAEQRWKEAKAKLEQVRPAVLGNTELVRQVDLYLGQCHAQLDEYDSQLEVNRRILSDDPSSLAARAGAAQALVSAGKTTEALAEFESIAAGISRDVLVTIPQVWYPLLQLRINSQAALPEPERDWSVVDRLLDALQRAGTVSPAQMAMLRGEALVRRGEVEAARQLLEAAATADADPQIWASLATLALREQGPQQALELLARVPERIKNAQPLLLVEAQAAARSPAAEASRLLDALEARADALEPAAAARVLATIAPIRLAGGDAAGAERVWRAAAKLEPEDVSIREAMLEMAIAAGDPTKAEGIAVEIAEIAGRSAPRTRVAEASVKILEARIELVKIQEQATEPVRDIPESVRQPLDEARGLLAEAENERPGWSQVQILFAEVDSLRGNRTAAIERLRRAIAVGPANPAVVRRLVGLLYAANRLEEAQEAMALLGDDGREGLERISAEVELQAGKFDEAVALAEQSVAGDSQNYEDLLWLGQLLARSGKNERADEVLERAAELAPDEPEVWLALFSHRMASGSPARAEPALERAAKLMPEPRRQLALAQGYEMLRRPDDAERCLLEAVAGWPEDLEAIRGLASFQIRKGREQEARSLLERILAAPDDAPDAAAKGWARRALAELEAKGGTYRQLRKAMKLLADNRGKDGDLSTDDLKLEIDLLANRPEPVSWRRAIRLLDELGDRQPLTTAEKLMRAQLRDKVGEWETARNEMVALVASPKTPPAYVALLVEKLLDHDELSTARTWMRRLEKASPGSAITTALKAKLAMAENDRKLAADYARQLMPGDDVTAENAAQLKAVGRLMEDLGFPKAADRVFEQFAAVSPGGAVARIEFLGRESRSKEALDLLEAEWDRLSLERALTLAVQVLRSEVDEPEAVAAAGRIETWIEKGKRIDPGSTVIRLLEAELRTLMGDEPTAEEIYRGLLARNDLPSAESAIISNNLAFQLARPETAAEARKLIDAAIEELGPLPDLLDTRGLVLLAQGDTAAAVADLRDAMLQPSPTKFLHLAAAELAAGDASAARLAIETARSKGLDKLRLVPADKSMLESVESVETETGG